MKKSNLNSCNVLEAGPDARRLWQFAFAKGQPRLVHEHAIPTAESLPPKAAAKSLLQKRLNIAWLPADQVFLRVVHLPIVEMAELVSMIEFQLEKLSPFPVNQIVWSMEVLPKTQESEQAVVVIIAARDTVEKFLGKLETDKFLADQLELPQLHLLLAASGQRDGVWIYPVAEASRILCLVAWRVEGAPRQVQLIYLAGAAGTAPLIAQLNETAWAGEMEGWLKSPMRVHLMAEPALASAWEAELKQWSGEPVTMEAPPTKLALAELSAGRAARGESKANLLPAEFATRYRQQFVDRIWMSGVGAVLAAYIVGALGYFGVLYFMGWKRDQVVQQVKAISGSYTNAIKAKEKIEVLQNHLDLKYAALEALRAISDNLPEGFKLQNFQFSRQKLTVMGTADAGLDAELIDYLAKLREARVDDHKVFSDVKNPRSGQRTAPGGAATITWTMECELARSDTNI